MGDRRLTQASYAASVRTYVPTRGPATRAAEERARDTGKLDPLVDPAEYGVIRRSLVRFDPRPDDLWTVTVGLPVPIETRLDTTGSMGHFVDVALEVLPNTYDLTSAMLPECDLQIATGIFGDCIDRFVLCRPQFEMEAEKIVRQLSLMAPQRGGGGNGGEDPHYGIFGGAYLTNAYINRIGLKGYDFTVTDEPARAYLSADQLMRIYGEHVFEKVAENGFEINRQNLPTTREVVDDLLKRTHGFVLSVGDRYNSNRFWMEHYGEERVILLPDIRYLAHAQAVIVGLTEGTLSLEEVEEFMRKHGVEQSAARALMRSVVNIPLGAQAALPNFGKGPKAGDVFREKTDLWPMDPSEVPILHGADDEPDGPIWGVEDNQI